MSIREILSKSKRKKQKAQVVDSARKVGMGLGLGAALGSALGVLFAPKSGKETRQDIADGAKDTVVSLKENAGEVGEQISKIVEDGKEKIAALRASRISENEVAEDEVAAEGEKCSDDIECCCGGCEDIDEEDDSENENA